MMKSVITGTGTYIPEVFCPNEHFVDHVFYDSRGLPIPGTSASIIEKFRKITGIRERRYAPPGSNTSDIAAFAGMHALKDAGIDPETLDQIIVAHNFGDVDDQSLQSQIVPSLASKVKHRLGIHNPGCIAYDIIFGCPGWIQALIQSEAYFKAGMAKKVLLIGAETLSRIVDPGDRDSMIFADGAGACVLECLETGKEGSGILGTCSQTYSLEEVNYINMGKSYGPCDSGRLFMKMKGRKVYEYALVHVPAAIRHCIEGCGIQIGQVKKIFIHQANEKMDEEIIKRLFESYGLSAPPYIMPMNIQWLGNSSVATVPTLYHMVRKGDIAGHEISGGDIIVFASVGAGMNINAVCYRV
ncbi:MAG: ketoacyl-ACP synthase III [Chitinophagaceae bacterium]|nr:ketoacyl-ACP synthase III [Chitinophagaceae bacterium]